MAWPKLPVDEQTIVRPAATPSTKKFGTTSLEAAQWVGGLDLHDYVTTEDLVQHLVCVLRCMQEHGVDAARRILDSRETQIHGSDCAR